MSLCRVGLCVVGMNDEFSFRPNGLHLALSHDRLKYRRYMASGMKFLPFGGMSTTWNPAGLHAMGNMNFGD
jgi:hypothetical protein